MTKLIIEYRGVILFFAVLVFTAGLINNRVKEINSYENANNVAYYEK